MPLLNLKTNLKSLRFGRDRPDGGSSNQPYITTTVPVGFRDINNPLLTLGSKDFLLRGGTSAFVDSAQDVIRLSKMFTDLKTPSGIQFSAKQQLLSRTAVKLQAGVGGSGLYYSFYGGDASLRNSISPLNAGVYNPLSTIAQAGVNAFGGHLNKQGINPISNSPLSIITYSDLVTTQQPKELNRLLHLKNNLVNPKSDPVNLFSYSGGPGSNLGIGNTNIRFASQRTGDSNPLRTNDTSRFYGTGGATFTGTQLLQQDSFRTTAQIQDFRKKIQIDTTIPETQLILARKLGTLTAAPNYTEKNFETRVHLGDPGSRILNRENYTAGAITPDDKVNVVDKVNALYMYEAKGVTESVNKNDFVKFRFAVINPDNPIKKTFTHFRAIFNGDITDSMTSNWDSFSYLGRGEEFFNYNGFSRDVSFSFTVFAQSKPELSIMYQKLNYLQSSLTPNFSNSGYMRGNIHQLTIGGYFLEQPGVITSLNYTMPQDSTWEIGIPSDSKDVESAGGITYRDPSVKELTHRIDVQVQFKPIHTFLPQIVGSSFDSDNKLGILGKNAITQRYSALSNITNSSGSLYAQGTPYATNLD